MKWGITVGVTRRDKGDTSPIGESDEGGTKEAVEVLKVELCPPLKRFVFEGRVYEADEAYTVTRRYFEEKLAERRQDITDLPVFQEYKPRKKKVVETIQQGVEDPDEGIPADRTQHGSARAARRALQGSGVKV